jgi:peptide/nickel transport system permease protein
VIADASDVVIAPQRPQRWAALRLPRTKIGLVICGVIILLALFGPLFAPHSPTAFVGKPFSSPSSSALLGTDTVGRDVLSRFLHGGQSIIVLSLLATILNVGGGLIVALVAGYSMRLGDELLMRGMDVLRSSGRPTG